MPSAAQCCPDEIPCRTLQLALAGTGACLGGASCSWPTQQLPMRKCPRGEMHWGQGSSYELEASYVAGNSCSNVCADGNGAENRLAFAWSTIQNGSHLRLAGRRPAAP